MFLNVSVGSCSMNNVILVMLVPRKAQIDQNILIQRLLRGYSVYYLVDLNIKKHKSSNMCFLITNEDLIYFDDICY